MNQFNTTREKNKNDFQNSVVFFFFFYLRLFIVEMSYGEHKKNSCLTMTYFNFVHSYGKTQILLWFC